MAPLCLSIFKLLRVLEPLFRQPISEELMELSFVNTARCIFAVWIRENESADLVMERVRVDIDTHPLSSAELLWQFVSRPRKQELLGRPLCHDAGCSDRDGRST